MVSTKPAAAHTQESLHAADLRPLSAWVADQPPWSDFPIVVLTRRGGGLGRDPELGRLLELLGNVTLLERPFHPMTMLSVVETALRRRRRQYEAYRNLEQIELRQQAMEESEARFRTLADNIPVLTWTARADGWVYRYNSRW